MKLFKILTLTAGVVIASFGNGKSQTVQQTSLWNSWLSGYKLNDKWSLYWDTQIRSSDDVKYLRNLLIRPGITYNFNKTQNATLGYAWVGVFNPDDAIDDKKFTEHRIWEQFIQTHKIGKAFAMHRFRVEQRFIGRGNSEDLFSQRFRYFARVVLPFKKYDNAFKKGPYVALQDEVFLHLQNKDQLNNSTFDQNRAYLALGTRLSPVIDVEVGYMNQYVKGAAINTSNNIAQLGIITRF